jgi:hypothetical protein
MGNYVFLNENNIVVDIIKGRDEDEVVDGISDWETHYGEFRGLVCKRTSRSGAIRKNFAGIGYTYDEGRDAFIPPKCHNEATLNEDTCLWDCSNAAHILEDN